MARTIEVWGNGGDHVHDCLHVVPADQSGGPHTDLELAASALHRVTGGERGWPTALLPPRALCGRRVSLARSQERAAGVPPCPTCRARRAAYEAGGPFPGGPEAWEDWGKNFLEADPDGMSETRDEAVPQLRPP